MKSRASILFLILLPVAAFSADPVVKAKVISVSPYVEQEMVPTTVQQCRDVQEVTQHKSSLAPSIVGALVGAAVGTQIGHGHANVAATSAGAVIGSEVGKSASASSNAREHTVVKQECDPIVQYETKEVKHYSVVYELDGQQFTTTTDTEPGKTIDIVLKT